MLHLALFEPEIAGNVGTIARTCMATGTRLHLIRPLGFRLTDEALKRAGMDYWQEVDVHIHVSYSAFYATFAVAFEHQRVYALSTKASQGYSDISYVDDSVLLFGPESRGLPLEVRQQCQALRIPMHSKARSLNIAVSAGVTLYEVIRQGREAGWLELS